MTGKERALAALRGKPHDRPPVIPIVGQTGAILSGVSIYDHAHDPNLLARCQVEWARKLRYDGIYISADCWLNAEAIGFPEVNHPRDEPAVGHGTWLQGMKDLERLELPDPERSGRWPLMIEATRQAVKLAGDELLIIANFDQSPFSLACQLRNINLFMMDLIENKVFAHRLLEFCTEAVSRFAIALAKAGGHIVNTGDSPAGGSLIGGPAYEEFAFPYEKRVFENIRRAVNVPITLHICGDSSTCIRKMVETGADGIDVDYVMDLKSVREICKEQVTVTGNVNPLLLLKGTPEQVKAASLQCLRIFEGSDRYILSTGCCVPPQSSPENIAAMAEAVDEFCG
jgi:MtaA/CmuA family methyltransferase